MARADRQWNRENPTQSLLIEKVSGAKPEMPQKGQSLAKEQVASLRQWIKEGARWPDGIVLRDRQLEEEKWWAIQPLDRPKIPDVKNPVVGPDADRCLRPQPMRGDRSATGAAGRPPHLDTSANI